MKKIGLVTIIDYQNYGNRLQNYAAQEILKNLGFEVVTILNTQKKIPTDHLPFIKKISNVNMGVVLKKIDYFINKKKYNEAKEKKIDRFKAFSKKYINESNYEIKINSIPKNLDSKFDFFVVGSDQVWNPFYRGGSEIDFLTFADQKKRVSYSASFGVSKIPEEFKDNYKKWLGEFRNISVREDTGAEIVSNLTGKNVPVLVDPTLMLEDTDWLKISKTSANKPKKKFILVYVLGKKTAELLNFMKDISKKYNLDVINIADLNDLKYYSTSPDEFIDLVSSCEMVITDSFHATVFSIIFNKPFIVFERVDNDVKMNSRINTLLSRFDFEERTWQKIDKSSAFKISFDHVSKILDQERNKTINYLTEALNIVE